MRASGRAARSSVQPAEEGVVPPPKTTSTEPGGFARMRLSGNIGFRTDMAVLQRWDIRIKLWFLGLTDTENGRNIRNFLKGKNFAIISMVCLVIALYFPDLFVIGEAQNNWELDLILSMVFLVFAAEWMLLSVLDFSYLFGFFWMMDLVGTCSMFFDISYTYSSVSATQPLIIKQAVGEQQTTQVQLLRAARVAKLGARAGRISRVIKVLRFLPFLNLRESDGSQMARVISSQLTSVLATRVACLTIILVIFVPLITFFQFPDYDYSIKAAPLMLYDNYHDFAEDKGGESSALRTADLYSVLDEFYAKTLTTYGIYDICMGNCSGQRCDCIPISPQTLLAPGYSWSFRSPKRKQNIIHVIRQHVDVHTNQITGDYIVSFTMKDANSKDAWINLSLITFVIVVMCTFGLVLSNSVSDLALNPMERMLAMVREIAATVFKTVDNMQQADTEDIESDEEDVFHASEMVLLEKVVRKLALMADLAQKKAEDVGIALEDLKDEELGVLNLIQEGRIQQHKEGPEDTTQQDHANNKTRGHNHRLSAKNVNIDPKVLGVTEQQYNSWDLHTPDILEKKQRIAFAVFCVLEFPGCASFCHQHLKTDVMIKFTQQVEVDYFPSNPYHNFLHGLDVVFTVQRMMKVSFSSLYLLQIEQMSLLISAICHDIGHPGVNNPFLVDTGHELAVRYNDRSPLENMHCARMFQIAKEDSTRIFANFSNDQYKEIRKLCVEVILHTDMTMHFTMIKDIQMLQLQMNEDELEMIDPQEGPGDAEVELLKVQETRHLLLKLILHAADVSNPCKPWHICRYWAYKVLNEFFNQGDKEKALGIPVQMLNDRDKVNTPNSQIGFIEFVVAPLILTMVKLMPPLFELSRNIHLNVCHWADMHVAESNPNEEDKVKLTARVDKLRVQTEEAEQRLTHGGGDNLDAGGLDHLPPLGGDRRSKAGKPSGGRMSVMVAPKHGGIGAGARPSAHVGRP